MRVFEQHISNQQLRDYQLAALNRQIAWAAEHSRFYAGCRGLRLHDTAELSRLPFTRAADLLERGGEMLCLPARQVRRVISLRSSGSSGGFKRLHFSDDDIQQTVDFFAVGMRYLCAAGQRVMICMPADTPDGVGQLLARGLRQMGAEPLLYGAISDYQAAAELLRRQRPHTIVGIPAQLRRLALTVPDSPPANVLLSADRVGAAVSDTIRRRWRCEVFEHYGLTESGLGGAVDCAAHQGLHIRHDALYIEIVAAAGDEPLAAGAWGEIVLTTLGRQAMPLLRYRSGDMGRLLDAPCGCGSVLPRLQVAGRLSELARPLSVYDLDELLLAEDGVLDYRAVWQDDSLCVSVAGDREAAERLLRRVYPELRLLVSGGAGFDTRGTAKRHIGGS